VQNTGSGPAQTSPPAAQQSGQGAAAVARSSGAGLALAEPSVTRGSPPSRALATPTAGDHVPVRSVPVGKLHHGRSVKRAQRLVHRTAVSTASVTRFGEPWRHAFTVSSPVAALRSLLPLPRRSGLLLLVGAVALLVLAAASASLMRMLMRAGEG
jgi:hypothetical protein